MLALPLFVYADYVKDGRTKTAHIQTRTFGDQKQDCKIGDFSENWYLRPKKAVQCKEYKTVADYKRAIRLCIQKNLNCKVLRVYAQIEAGGNLYDKEL
jgi:hypothetical protein